MNQQATPYELLGGDAGVRALADAFYDAMDRLPQAQAVRAMHAQNLQPMKTKLYEFLSGWLGGPRLYFEKYGNICMHSAHGSFPIGTVERDQWLACMDAALEAVHASEEVKQILRGPVYRFADALRNRDA